jgi:hypothetical protein
MSAYMHDPAHIDTLVHAALRFSSSGLTWQSGPNLSLDWQRLKAYDYDAATRIGKILLRENAESMAYRYNMKDLDNDADGGTRSIEYLGYLALADEYKYSINDNGKPWRVLPAVAILKAIDSYEYQSCEHPEWKESEARHFCDALRHSLIERLPGYEQAETWSICA